jgi:hypothetical protein
MVLAMMRANVVFPTPGGPHRMNETMRPDEIIVLKVPFSPMMCFCPQYVSKVVGRKRSANGCMRAIYGIS